MQRTKAGEDRFSSLRKMIFKSFRPTHDKQSATHTQNTSVITKLESIIKERKIPNKPLLITFF